MSETTEPAPRDYAGMPLTSVQPDTDPLPDRLAVWVTYGYVDGRRHIMPNPYEDHMFAPSGDTVQAWVRRRASLDQATLPASPLDKVERVAMDRVASLQGASVRLRKTLDAADGVKQDWRKSLLALAARLKEEADSRDWCEEYDNLMDDFCSDLPGSVEWEFRDAAIRTVEMKMIRRRKFVVWVEDSTVTEEPVTSKDDIDASDYFDDDSLPYQVERMFESEDVYDYMDTREVTWNVEEVNGY